MRSGTEWRVDRQVEQILDTITEDEAFTRLVAERIEGVTAGDFRASLRRSGLRSFYPRVEAFTPRSDVRLEEGPIPAVGSEPKAAEGTTAPVPQGNRREKVRRMKTPEMVERDLLPIGTSLTIKDRPDSSAIVVNGRRVEYRGEVMSFNAWGRRVTGWSAIRIYKWAMMPDGRLLDDLRDD